MDVLQAQLPARYLGLDLNLRSTGFAVLADDGQVLRHGCFKAPPNLSVLGSANAVVTGLGEMSDDIAASGMAPAAWYVGIEEYMKTFKPGRFQTRSLFSMAQLNGIVAFECMRMFGEDSVGQTECGDTIAAAAAAAAVAAGAAGAAAAFPPPREPLQVHPTRARAAYGLRKNAAQPDVKAAVYEFAMAHEPRLAQHAVVARSGKFAGENFDVTDAWLIARFTRHTCQARVLEAQPELRSKFREQLGTMIDAGLPKRQHEAALQWEVVLRELLLKWCVEADARPQAR
jgi:hypothetical protein